MERSPQKSGPDTVFDKPATTSHTPDSRITMSAKVEDIHTEMQLHNQADLCKEMLRRCFAKRVQSAGACLVLLFGVIKTIDVPNQ